MVNNGFRYRKPKRCDHCWKIQLNKHWHRARREHSPRTSLCLYIDTLYANTLSVFVRSFLDVSKKVNSFRIYNFISIALHSRFDRVRFDGKDKKNSFFSLIIFISETKNFTINMHSSQLDSPCPSRCTHCFCNYNSNRRMSIALLFLRAFRWKIPRTSDQISQWRLRKLDIFIWRMALGACNRISDQLYCVSCHMYWLIDRSADWRHSQSNPEYYVDSSIVWWTIANFPPVCVCGPISK